jgi:hypothetical protein
VLCKDSVRTTLQTLSMSVIKTSFLMLYKAEVAISFEIHTKLINAICSP